MAVAVLDREGAAAQIVAAEIGGLAITADVTSPKEVGEAVDSALARFGQIDLLARQGRTEEATATFERLLGLCNDVGLLAEEYDPAGKRQLGNFPQAFSHVGLVNTAMNLSHGVRGPSKQRPHN